MIHESAQWKAEIKRHRDLILRWRVKMQLERAFFYVERGIFISAFCVRKLIENRKVTDSLARRSVAVKCMPAKMQVSKSVVDSFGSPDILKLYDFGSYSNYSISVYELMSQFIHSHAIGYGCDESDRLDEVIVASYKISDEKAYIIGIDDFCDILSIVLENEINEYSSNLDEGGRVKLTVK